MFKLLKSRIKIFWNLIKSAWKLAKDISLKIQGTPMKEESWILLRTDKGNILTTCYNPKVIFKNKITLSDGSCWIVTYKPYADL